MTHFQIFHASNEYFAFQFCSKSTQNFSLTSLSSRFRFTVFFFISFCLFIFHVHQSLQILFANSFLSPFHSHYKNIDAIAMCFLSPSCSYVLQALLPSVPRKQNFLTTELAMYTIIVMVENAKFLILRFTLSDCTTILRVEIFVHVLKHVKNLMIS